MTSTTDWISKRLDEIAASARESGRLAELRRFIDLLTEKGAIRDSMLGAGWLVLYTENGPIDIKTDEFSGMPAEKKEETNG